MPMNRTFGFQDINVAVRGLTSGASAGTAKTVGLGTTSTANAPSQPIISSSESKWYDGAGYFNAGSTQYLTLPSGNNDLAFGTSSFTIECWVNYSVNGIIYSTSTDQGDWKNIGTGYFALYASGDNAYIPTSGTQSAFTPLVTTPTNQWCHIAYVKSGNTLTMYLNGVYNGQGTDVNSTLGNASSGVPGISKFDMYSGGRGYMTGYIQDYRIYKGFAKYTANFTPPQPICGFTTDISTQPGFTTTTATGATLTSTVGLGSTSTLAFDATRNYAGVTSITSSSGITTLPDAYAQNLVLALPLANITGVGNSFTNDRNTQIRSISLVGGGTAKTITNTGVSTVAISTSKWYGNTANFVSASSQYLTAGTSTDYVFGTGDFTVECWAYFNSLQAENALVSMHNGDSNWVIKATSSNLLIYTGSTNVTGSLAISTGKWYHFAVTRQSSTLKLWINGNNDTSATVTNNYTISNTLYIGAQQNNPAATYLNGYLQDVKIYNGLAKYTTNFTPPPPMFGDYTRSTPNKLIYTPSSDYVLEAKNTSGVTTSNYSATRQWGTKPKGGIYDPYASNLVLAIPGGAVSAATSTYDVTGQIRYETPTASYVNAGIVTYSNSLGIGTYQNKTVTNTNVSISSTIGNFYGTRSMRFNGSTTYLETSNSNDFVGTGDFTVEGWFYPTASQTLNPRLFAQNINDGSNWDCYLEGSSGTSPINMNGSATNLGMSFPSANNWHHFCIVRSNGILYSFMNGVLQKTQPYTNSIGVSNTGFRIGEIGANTTQGYKFNGYVTDFRLYKGLAKYTSNFTPPNQIYLT
jgi:hypothetical protein